MSRGIWRYIIRFVRNNIKAMLFLAAFTTFFYLNTLLLNDYLKLEWTNSYNNTPYNAYAEHFIMSSGENNMEDLSILQGTDILDGCVLFKVNDSVQGIYEVVYCDKEAIALHSGVITEWDCNSKEPVAIVGYNSSHSIGDSIVYQEQEYIIAGVLEQHISESVNYGIFCSDNRLDNVEMDCGYVLTSTDYQKVQEAFDKLKNILEEQHIQLKEIDVRETEFGDYIRYDSLVGVIFGILAMFYILILCVSKRLWTIAKRPEVFVRTLLGERNVRLKVNLQYTFILLVSYGISYILGILTIGERYFSYISAVF